MVIKKCSAGISLIILLLFASVVHAESSMRIRGGVSGGYLLADLQQRRCAVCDHEPDSQTGINALIDFEFNGHSFGIDLYSLEFNYPSSDRFFASKDQIEMTTLGYRYFTPPGMYFGFGQIFDWRLEQTLKTEDKVQIVYDTNIIPLFGPYILILGYEKVFATGLTFGFHFFSSQQHDIKCSRVSHGGPSLSAPECPSQNNIRFSTQQLSLTLGYAFNL